MCLDLTLFIHCFSSPAHLAFAIGLFWRCLLSCYLKLYKVCQHCCCTAAETPGLGWCCRPQHCGRLSEHAGTLTRSSAKSRECPDRKEGGKSHAIIYKAHDASGVTKGTLRDKKKPSWLKSTSLLSTQQTKGDTASTLHNHWRRGFT